MTELASPSRGGPPAGLCDSCGFQQEVRTTRGSRFSLCRRSREDPAYPRYPRLPVQACAGYAPRADAAAETRPAPAPPPRLISRDT